MTWVMTGTRRDEGHAVSTRDLVVDAKSGDKRAFEELVIRNERRVLMTALRILGNLEDARDAGQEVFLRLFKYLGRFDESRSLGPWLYRMTVNVCRDIARKRSKWSSVEDEQLERLVSPETDHDVSVRIDQKQIAIQGLKTLSEKERSALVLRDIEGLSTREVARILGSTEITVRSHISRARVKMKRYRDQVLGRVP
jgi:RNA polymerase sigma-70 factor (ECF subfamily)